MTKKKIIKLFAILAAVFLGSLEMGWRFFNMVVCCKRGEQKKERKKWFELSHIRENHPQNGYAREYNESKEWCFEQNMQDCYIKSIDKYIILLTIVKNCCILESEGTTIRKSKKLQGRARI